MTSPRTRALDLLAPTPRPAQASPGPDDARLRDEQMQLARLDLSLAQAQREGDTGLAGRLKLLRHAQRGREMEARRRVGDRLSFQEFLEGMQERIVAMGLGGRKGAEAPMP